MSFQEDLVTAELELAAWATGKRSWINEMLTLEARPEDRAQTLALSDARDADNIRMAREKVLALRALCGITPEGNDPYQLALFLAARTGHA